MKLLRSFLLLLSAFLVVSCGSGSSSVKKNIIYGEMVNNSSRHLFFLIEQVFSPDY